MITFKQLTFTYPNRPTPILKDVDLDIEDGDFVLVIGPSGAGKSTLLRCINGLVPHFSGGYIGGELIVNGLNPVLETPQVMSEHVGFVFQDPENQFVMNRVEDELAFALENSAMPAQEMRLRVEEVLDLLDLAPLRHRSLDTLSGGEKQRVAIAAALAFRPGILVLDEPTSQLDPKSAEDVLQALVRLNADLGLTIILAEHRLERVLPFVDGVIYVFNEAKQLLSGPPTDVLAHVDLKPPLIALAQALDWHPLPLTIKAGRRFSREWLKNNPISPSQPQASSPMAAPTLQANGVHVAYKNNAVLQGVDLEIYPGEIVALMGRNGAGKSTLLKSFVGLIKAEKGYLSVNGQSIANQDVAEICQSVAYLPQDPNALLFAETVLDELLITLNNHNLSPATVPLKPERLLETLGLKDKATAYPRDLSTGERQRVALAAITITQPGALLLDEPTRGLDYLNKATLINLLKQWRDNGMAILLVSHDVELVAQIADRVVLLSQGQVIADDLPHAVLGNSPLFAPQVARLFPETGWLTVNDVLQRK